MPEQDFPTNEGVSTVQIETMLPVEQAQFANQLLLPFYAQKIITEIRKSIQKLDDPFEISNSYLQLIPLMIEAEVPLEEVIVITVDKIKSIGDSGKEFTQLNRLYSTLNEKKKIVEVEYVKNKAVTPMEVFIACVQQSDEEVKNFEIITKNILVAQEKIQLIQDNNLKLNFLELLISYASRNQVSTSPLIKEYVEIIRNDDDYDSDYFTFEESVIHIFTEENRQEELLELLSYIENPVIKSETELRCLKKLPTQSKKAILQDAYDNLFVNHTANLFASSFQFYLSGLLELNIPIEPFIEKCKEIISTFEMSLEKDTTWKSIISVLLEFDKLPITLQLLEEINEPEARVSTIIEILPIIFKNQDGNIKLYDELNEYIETKDSRQQVKVYNTLINALCKKRRN